MARRTVMKYELTEVKSKSKDIVKETLDYHLEIGGNKLQIHSYAVRNWDNTYSGVYHIFGSFGWAGGVGFKNFSVNGKLNPNEAYEAVVKKAEKWISKNLER